MKNDNVISLETPVENEDLLTCMLRQGAQELISKAVQAELDVFLSQYEDLTDTEGRKSVVRNGYLPEREIMTGIGEVAIKVPRTRDRSGQGIQFRSELLPPYSTKCRFGRSRMPNSSIRQK